MVVWGKTGLMLQRKSQTCQNKSELNEDKQPLGNICSQYVGSNQHGVLINAKN